MSRMWAWMLLVAASLISLAGCQRGERAPALSIPAQKQSPEQKIVGNWKGEFVFDDDVDVQKFDARVIAACKSSRIDIEFHENGYLKMRVTMTFPDGEEKTEVQGKWKFIRAEGDTITIRSTHEGERPEDVTLRFRDDDTLEMDGLENPLEELGVMRFHRASS